MINSKVGSWVVVAGCTLAMVLSIDDCFGLPKQACALAGAVLLSLCALKELRRFEAWPWFSILIGVFLLSASRSVDVPLSLIGPRMSQEWNLLTLCSCLAVCAAAATAGADLEDSAEAMSWCAVPLVIYAVAQRIYNPMDPLGPWNMAAFELRAFSFQGSPLYLAAVSSIIFVASSHLALRHRGRRGIAGLAGAGCAVACVILSQTRMGLLACAGGFGVYLFMAGLLSRPKALLACGMAGAAALALSPRLLSLRSDFGRLELWKAALSVFLENPILGCGPDAFGIALREKIGRGFVAWMGGHRVMQEHAHNLVLESLAGTGLLGSAALAAACWAVWRGTRKIEPGRRAALAGCAAAAGACAFVNPLPLSALGLIALAAGSCQNGDKGESRKAVALHGLACLGLLLVTLRLCGAERQAELGIAAGRRGDLYERGYRHDAAHELNPWDSWHSAKAVESLLDLIPFYGPADKIIMARRAVEIADASVRLHPNDAQALELRGLARTWRALYGGAPRKETLELAMADYKRAQGRAPTFGLLMERRRRLARYIGDPAEFKQADSEMRRVEAWSMEGRD